MRIEMLADRPEHWSDGDLDGKGVVRKSGEVLEVGEDSLTKVQRVNAELWLDRGWAKKSKTGSHPVNDAGDQNVN